MLSPSIHVTWRPQAAAARILRVLLHPYVLFTLVALVAWLPDGFNIGPVNDGWIKLETFLNNTRIYVVHGTRVYGSVPREVGIRLADGGFQGWQGVLFLLTVLRAGLFYEIVRRLFPRRAAFAVACGLIALFHPADDVYFWVDVTGVHMGLVLTLAACLCALVNLQTGNRAALLGMFFFQIFSCLTYSAFLIVMLAFPLGVWVLHRMEGGKTSWIWLLKTGWLMPLYIAFQLYLILSHLMGHEGYVADLNLSNTLLGYGRELLLFFQHSWESVTDFEPVYFLWALPPAVLGFATARALGLNDEDPEPSRDWRWYTLFCLGLVILAVACYLPYATSQVRFGTERQLFGVGIFLFTLFLLPLFFWLPRFMDAPLLPWLLVALLAGFVTLTGLEKRAFWVGSYRTEERLLAAIAATVPQPPPDTMFVVHLNTNSQARALSGFYNRRRALELALHLMYRDMSLRASFTPYSGPLFDSRDGELSAVQIFNDNMYDSYAPPGKMLILDYGTDGTMRILDRDWLKRNAPAGADLSAYAPGDYGTTPRAGTVICTMLETSMRPAYCGAGTGAQ